MDLIMNVQGLGQIATTGLKPALVFRNRDEAKKPVFKIADTYEPSSAAERTELLQEIKKKIGSGFYNSEKVADDLSYGFANVLNQM
jgi:hypothetical protein